MPSIEVRTFVPPTARNVPLPNVTADKGGVDGKLRCDQSAPFVEVTILPVSCAATVSVPTATKRPLPKAIPDRLPEGKLTGRTHVSPFGEVAIALAPETGFFGPTATNVPLPKATP